MASQVGAKSGAGSKAGSGKDSRPTGKAAPKRERDHCPMGPKGRGRRPSNLEATGGAQRQGQRAQQSHAPTRGHPPLAGESEEGTKDPNNEDALMD